MHLIPAVRWQRHVDLYEVRAAWPTIASLGQNPKLQRNLVLKIFFKKEHLYLICLTYFLLLQRFLFSSILQNMYIKQNRFANRKFLYIKL